MNGSYRNDYDAALAQADALRTENDILRRENAVLRGETPPEPGFGAQAAATRKWLWVGIASAFASALFVGMAMVSAPGKAPAASATDVPSPADIDRAFASIQPALSLCRTGLNHAVTMSITFGSSGAITDATLVSPAEYSATGQCVARAVQSARVPAFRQASFNVRHVFIL